MAQIPAVFRGSKVITYADLPHLLEVDAKDREIVIGTDGVIDWRGDRPGEDLLQSGDRLIFNRPRDGRALSSIITRGAGSPPAIAIAAAQRPGASDLYPYYTAEDGRFAVVANGDAGDNADISWYGPSGTSPDDDYRPAAADRVAGADLANSAGSVIGEITWDDSGDTVELDAAQSGQEWRVHDVHNHRLTINVDTRIARFSQGLPAGLAVGDIIRIGEGGTFGTRSYTVESIDTEAGTATVAAFSTGGESVNSWRIYRSGRQLTGYQLRRPGYLLTAWQLWADGSYYGPGGQPATPVPFVLQVTDRDTNGSVTVVDTQGNVEAWSPGADGDFYPNDDRPVLVREIRHPTSITKFRAYFP